MAKRICSFPECERKAHARGYCHGHLNQVYKGLTLTPLKPYRAVKNGMKECAKCARSLPVASFQKKRGKYVQEVCRDCVSIVWRARTYKISFEEAARLSAVTHCDVCGTELVGRFRHVDHDHDTGVIRGVLCHSCNTTLGHCKDDPSLLRRLADYLERF